MRWLVIAIFFAASAMLADAQTPTASAWPFGTPAQGASLSSSTPPPRNVPLVEKTLEQLFDRTVSLTASKALELKPEQWKHAETENFILHFRRVRDVNAVAREIEFDLWFVAHELGATKAQYARKSHVFIFKDEPEWQKFLESTAHPSWSHSFASGDELFLDVRESSGAFDNENLAHETTHAVVSRLYRGRRWPLWLNEGFAEYMGRAAVAGQHFQSARRREDALPLAQLSVAELTALQNYPVEREQVHQLYESAEKLVRYLSHKYPKELFPNFVDRIVAGAPVPAALIAIYGNDFSDMPAFERKFARFTR